MSGNTLMLQKESRQRDTPIGIHCNRHDYKELYESRDSYLADFEEAYRAVLEVTGVKPVLYRFPGGRHQWL
ncbi:MAG: hypothetical protein ACLTDI_12955 [Acutalibacteraceae bacterium]